MYTGGVEIHLSPYFSKILYTYRNYVLFFHSCASFKVVPASYTTSFGLGMEVVVKVVSSAREPKLCMWHALMDAGGCFTN